MQFRPAIFIWFVFAQSFFKFHKNGDIQKLKAWSFWLWRNDLGRLYNEHAGALQSWITFFWYTLYNESENLCNIQQYVNICMHGPGKILHQGKNGNTGWKNSLLIWWSDEHHKHWILPARTKSQQIYKWYHFHWICYVLRVLFSLFGSV